MAAPFGTSLQTTPCTGVSRSGYLFGTLLGVHPALLIPFFTGGASPVTMELFTQLRLHDAANMTHISPLSSPKSRQPFLTIRPPLASDGRGVGRRRFARGGPIPRQTCALSTLCGVKRRPRPRQRSGSSGRREGRSGGGGSNGGGWGGRGGRGRARRGGERARSSRKRTIIHVSL
jgi:uncharacterized membrane protein YgcG